MTVLIKQARIIDPTSPYNNTIQDILVESGVIKQIGKTDGEAGETFSGKDSSSLNKGTTTDTSIYIAIKSC